MLILFLQILLGQITIWNKHGKEIQIYCNFNLKRFPPCNVSDFLNLPIKDRKNIIVSFA